MSGRQSGRSGKVFAQAGGGTPFAQLALADSGDHLNYAVASAANKPWGDVPAPTVRINGVTSGLGVTVDNSAANDTVDVAAGTAFLKGAHVSIAAGSVASLTRPSTANFTLVNAIVLNEDGTLAKVAGTEASSFSATLGAAGGQPLIGTTQVLLGTVTFSGTGSQTAAPVTAAQIDNSGVERGDQPGMKIDHFNGGVRLQHALEAIHTGPATRAIYAAGRIVALTEIFDLREYSLELGKDEAETNGFSDEYSESVPTIRSWSGSASGYHTSPFWFRAANRDGYMLLRFRAHADDPYEFEGVANVKWSMKNSPTEATMEDITFTGTGPLNLRAVTS